MFAPADDLLCVYCARQNDHDLPTRNGVCVVCGAAIEGLEIGYPLAPVLWKIARFWAHVLPAIAYGVLVGWLLWG